MNALNFYSPLVADQLRSGRKSATIRLGDKSGKYKKGMVVRVLCGVRFSPHMMLGEPWLTLALALVAIAFILRRARSARDDRTTAERLRQLEALAHRVEPEACARGNSRDAPRSHRHLRQGHESVDRADRGHPRSESSARGARSRAEAPPRASP